VIVAVIHQPDFLPWLGFFHRLLHADVYVALDNVQFVHSNRGWTHRDKIKTPHGAQWLTVSVRKTARATAIDRVELSDTADWRERNLNLLRQNYRTAPFFEEVYPRLEALYASPHAMLADFTLASIGALNGMLDIEIPVVRASSLNPEGAKNALLVDILRKVGAKRYLSGLGARAYFDPAPFQEAGIEVLWQDFRHPVYSQLHGAFEANLSAIDMLLNCGTRQSRQILREC
jgi:hypothetical protein